MNICLITYELPPSGGGEGVYTYNLAVGLSNRGHQVTIVSPLHISAGHMRESELFSDHNIRLLPVNVMQRPLARVSSFMKSSIRALREISSVSKIDVVHFTFDYPAYPPVDITGLDLPIVSTLHHLHIVEAISMLHSRKNPILLMPNVLRQFLLSQSEKKLLERSQRVIAVSQFTYRSAIQYAKTNPEILRMVPNGIGSNLSKNHDLSKTSKTFCNDYSTSPGNFVLYVGRIEQSKGIEYLIRGFAKVSRFKNLKLVIVGGGTPSYFQELKRASLEVDIANQVVFTGRITDEMLSGAYASCGIFVLPSLMEGFGYTLLEAMSFGKVVLATNVGGVPEIVKNGVNGFLVEPGSADQIGDKLLEIMEEPKIMLEIGESAKNWIENRYTVENMASQTEKVYREAILELKL